MIIAVDGGTSNTRVVLVENGKVKDKIKLSVGAGNYGGEKSNYISQISDAISRFENEADAVVLSGMIGSEKGLSDIPHISAPAGKHELHLSMMKAFFPEITPLPMYFIRGVKVEGNDFYSFDIMRGEETEIVGISALTGITDGVILLPGSHNKIITFESGKIIDFTTTISGELTRSVAEHTVISSGLAGGFSSTPDFNYLLKGYNLSKETGLNAALFKSRILERFFSGTDEKNRYSFVLGAVLAGDVGLAVSKSAGKPIVVAGSDPFKTAITHLLKAEGQTVLSIESEKSDIASSIGAEIIYRG